MKGTQWTGIGHAMIAKVGTAYGGRAQFDVATLCGISRETVH